MKITLSIEIDIERDSRMDFVAVEMTKLIEALQKMKDGVSGQ